MSELLGCPFCGGQPEHNLSTWPDGTTWHSFMCNNDECIDSYATRAAAIAAWNRRTDPTPTRAVIASSDDPRGYVYIDARSETEKRLEALEKILAQLLGEPDGSRAPSLRELAVLFDKHDALTAQIGALSATVAIVYDKANANRARIEGLGGRAPAGDGLLLSDVYGPNGILERLDAFKERIEELEDTAGGIRFNQRYMFSLSDAINAITGEPDGSKWPTLRELDARLRMLEEWRDRDLPDGVRRRAEGE